MQYHRNSLLMLVACSLLLPTGIVTAQESSEEGVVQLGHRAQARRAAAQTSADACDGCGPGSGDRRSRRRGYGEGNLDGDGRCRHYAAAYANGGRYGFGGNPHYSHCGIGHLLNACSPYHLCTYPPDHGFAPPAHRPICPTSASYSYSRAFPPSWTGEPLNIDPRFRHPLIYMPTDTTQLGYYYQHVPYWQPRPNMIPPVPHPDEWHTPDTGVVYTGVVDAAAGNLAGCHPGGLIDSGRPVRSLPMQGTPVEVMPLPAAPENFEPYDAAPVPMLENNPSRPYSPAPHDRVTPLMVPPAASIEDAGPVRPVALPGLPAPPRRSAGELERSTSQPRLIPVPQ